jgi:hypothetical protein
MANKSANSYESEATEEVGFHHYIQSAKVVSTQLITEQGAYKKDQLPDEYGGAVLEVEVVHAVYLTDQTGSTIKLEFDVPEAMDKEDKTGGPYNLDGNEIKEQSGESEEPTEMTTVKRETVSEDMAKARDYMITNYDKWDYFGTPTE